MHALYVKKKNVKSSINSPKIFSIRFLIIPSLIIYKLLCAKLYSKQFKSLQQSCFLLIFYISLTLDGNEIIYIKRDVIGQESLFLLCLGHMLLYNFFHALIPSG